MTKQALLEAFIRNHREIINYVDRLNDTTFQYHSNDKWTAGQQLQHIFLTLVPFPKVLASKTYIQEKFGKPDRPAWSYDTVLENYLQTSLQAPAVYLPEAMISPGEKEQLISDIQEILAQIVRLLEHYSEEELDTLLLPHPLLGNLSIREMFYLMTYHPIHHLRQIKQIQEKG